MKNVNEESDDENSLIDTLTVEPYRLVDPASLAKMEHITKEEIQDGMQFINAANIFWQNEHYCSMEGMLMYHARC